MKNKPLTSVFFLGGCDAATTYEYRVLQKQEQLALHGIHSVTEQNPSRESITQALLHDVLCLYRVGYNPFVEDLIQQARGQHIPVIFDVDDLVFEPEIVSDPVKKMPPDQALIYYESLWYYRRTFFECDYVITSTQHLAEAARSHGKQALVHRNGLSQWMIETAERLMQQGEKQRERDKFVIGYSSGTATHDSDFLEASPALAEILTRYPLVEVHIVGPLTTPPELKAFGQRVRNLPLVRWKDLPAILNTFDLNLAPLEQTNPFCQAKSEIKYTETAILGIPTIASRTDAFELAIKDGENGFLAQGADEWLEKLERLVTDPALRRRVGKAARADVLERYTPVAMGKQLVTTLETVRKQYAQQRRTPEASSAPDPRPSPLIINWVVHEPTPGSGGHTDIVRMINLLASFGHQVNVYMVPVLNMVSMSDLEIRTFMRHHFADLDGCLFKWTEEPMAESDVVVLTSWETAYMVNAVKNTSNILYFVQDWEPFFSPMGTEYLHAEQTYKMGFPCITLGRWLADYLHSQYNADTDYFDLAVEHEIYYPHPVAKSSHPRICFYARPTTPRRLFPLGMDSLRLIHQQRPDVEILFYGCKNKDLYPFEISFPFTNLGILKEHELAELFSSSDVGIVLSATNCSLVPPEMMACRCAVVDLNRETVKSVLEHEVNALLAEPTPEAIAEAVIRLLENDSLRQRLVETAYQQVQQLSWTKSARKVEEILYHKLPPSRRGLAPHKSGALPSHPALADLPSQQQECLNLFHRKRRQLSAQILARAKNWIKRLLQIDRGLTLAGAPTIITGELYGKRQIGQSFVARYDNLHRIDIMIGTYGRRNTRDVILHLKESPTAEGDLATTRLNTSLLPNSGYASFAFDPQPQSRGKSFYFCVTSPESVPGDAITLWTYHRATPDNTKLYVDGRVRRGQLVFGTFYLDERWGEISERPYAHDFRRFVTLRQQVTKLRQLLTSRDWSRLKWEVIAYLQWKIKSYS